MEIRVPLGVLKGTSGYTRVNIKNNYIEGNVQFGIFIIIHKEDFMLFKFVYLNVFYAHKF